MGLRILLKYAFSLGRSLYKKAWTPRSGSACKIPVQLNLLNNPLASVVESDPDPVGLT
jgi:hypothetical protein